MHRCSKCTHKNRGVSISLLHMDWMVLNMVSFKEIHVFVKHYAGIILGRDFARFSHLFSKIALILLQCENSRNIIDMEATWDRIGFFLS